MQVFGLDYAFTYFWLGSFGVSGIVSLSCPPSTKGLMYFFLFFVWFVKPILARISPAVLGTVQKLMISLVFPDNLSFVVLAPLLCSVTPLPRSVTFCSTPLLFVVTPLPCSVTLTLSMTPSLTLSRQKVTMTSSFHRLSLRSCHQVRGHE